MENLRDLTNERARRVGEKHDRSWNDAARAKTPQIA